MNQEIRELRSSFAELQCSGVVRMIDHIVRQQELGRKVDRICTSSIPLPNGGFASLSFGNNGGTRHVLDDIQILLEPMREAPIEGRRKLDAIVGAMADMGDADAVGDVEYVDREGCFAIPKEQYNAWKSSPPGTPKPRGYKIPYLSIDGPPKQVDLNDLVADIEKK